MPPQDKVENPIEGDKGTGADRPADNLSGSRNVDGKTVEAVQKTNRNFRNSTSDIPDMGATGKSASNTGFCITDGHQVIASKQVAGQSTESLFGVPAELGADGRKYLQGHISNVPELSQGVQNLDDLKGLVSGISRGIAHVAGDAVYYLRKPNAVNDSLISIGPALDNAVDYCSNTPPDKVLRDTHDALGYLGQAVEDILGYPLNPEQQGEHSGEAMAMMSPWGIKNAKVSENFPRLLATAENTSPKMKAALERTVADLPEIDRKYLEDTGGSIVGVRRLTDYRTDLPTNVEVHGLYSQPEKRVYVPEEVPTKDGQWIKNDSVALSTRHEIGHHINVEYGRAHAGIPVSEAPRFQEAYARDLEYMSTEMKDKLSRYVAGTAEARDEVFSELYALESGPAPSEYRNYFESAFPEVAKLLNGE